MYSPRSSVKVKAPAVPTACGVAIPQNPQDLLKMIQKQHKKNIQNATKQSNIVDRARKQEEQRELFERKLMEFEDFMYKADGADRINRHFECLKMEMEDDYSMQIEQLQRNKMTLDLRDKVKREVEERQREEELLREKRKQAAEARRAAVVERLRKKAEEEERQLREAEEALLRIEQEKERRVMEEIQRLAANRSGFTLEDELSKLAEQTFKEQLEKQAWELQERKKLEQWEAELRAKEEIENEQRKARMAALAEKKAKLAQLQKLKSGAGGASSSAMDLEKARDEAAKLNKQLRIQNRAKFVTKRIQNSNNANADGATVEGSAGDGGADNDTAAVGMMAAADAETGGDGCIGLAQTPAATAPTHSNNANMTHSSGTKGTVTAPTQQNKQQTQQQQQSQYQLDFITELQGVSSESELHDMQKALMAEKRGLRLEQKQRLAMAGSAQDATSVQLAKELRQKLADVTFKEKEVQKRLTELMQAQKQQQQQQAMHGDATGEQQGDTATTTATAAAATTATTTATAADANSDAVKPPAAPSSAATHTTSDANKDTNSGGGQSALRRRDSGTAAVDPTEALFKKAEQMLREGGHLLLWLKEMNGEIDKTARVAALQRRSFRGSFNLPVAADETAMYRQVTVCLMEIAQLTRSIKNAFDPINYAEKLGTLSEHMKVALDKCPPAGEGPAVSAATAASAAMSKEEEEREETKQIAAVKTQWKQQSERNLERRAQSEQQQQQSQQQQQFQQQPHKDKLVASRGVVEQKEGDAKSNITSNKTTADNLSTGMGTEVAVDEDDEDNDEDDEEDDEEGEGGWESELNVEDLPGWAECLQTSMSSAAHHAAFYGYIEVLEFLCRYFDCFIMDHKQRTPLFYAALQNRLDCVACLVALDPQWIDVGDENGDTSLHAAAIANGIETLSFLLSCEANPDTANYAGLTPCHLARSRAALESLCGAGAQPYCVDVKSRMPVWLACSDGRADSVEYLCSVTPAHYLLWPDDDGETCLHVAAANGHADCVEAVCQWLQGVEELCTVNKKGYTAAHVAGNAAVLKSLYENGANLWLEDSKGRMPLFISSFFGQAECVAFLLDAGRPGSAGVSSSSAKSKKDKLTEKASLAINAKDIQGDTALHCAAVCGHTQCTSLLLYFIRGSKNKQQLTAEQLAIKGGHQHIARMIRHVEEQKEQEGKSSLDIYGCDFETLSSVIIYYGSRWTKSYDTNYSCAYYLDQATGQSQWERPESYDEPQKDEERFDRAAELLVEFYTKYNSERLAELNAILTAYKHRYTDLFISLANKYNVEDLTMFRGVDFD